MPSREGVLFGFTSAHMVIVLNQDIRINKATKSGFEKMSDERRLQSFSGAQEQDHARPFTDPRYSFKRLWSMAPHISFQKTGSPSKPLRESDSPFSRTAFLAAENATGEHDAAGKSNN